MELRPEVFFSTTRDFAQGGRRVYTGAGIGEPKIPDKMSIRLRQLPTQSAHRWKALSAIARHESLGLIVGKSVGF